MLNSQVEMNVDPNELRKFSEVAHRWWDPKSEFRPLHKINPVRLQWINSYAKLSDKRILDVGCGGGILSESMAKLGASVKGIDLSPEALGVADLHSLESGITLDYELIAAEALAVRSPASFDVVTCMELLEHVPDPGATVRACAQLVKPGGWVFFSTINRTLKAYLLAIIAAEYVVRLLPRGTHDYARFIRPAELAMLTRSAGLLSHACKGIVLRPLTQTFALADDTNVNYMFACRRPI